LLPVSLFNSQFREQRQKKINKIKKNNIEKVKKKKNEEKKSTSWHLYDALKRANSAMPPDHQPIGTALSNIMHQQASSHCFCFLPPAVGFLGNVSQIQHIWHPYRLAR
jgi:hypothetical protein